MSVARPAPSGVLAGSPDHAYATAVALHKEGRPADAAALFRAILDGHPRLVAVNLALGTALLDLEDWAGALDAPSIGLPSPGSTPAGRNTTLASATRSSAMTMRRWPPMTGRWPSIPI
ncbi:tetratricopeptide repeat protein [Azospirillum sp. RWY-5-1]|uniref:Tetratricopeptide repeat protein n=1 Tax=Azospirillum oleiclasticum TaxID=2735135 RepID=A0ABX2THZ9_9PROT|nr:tetratricopeptide repeat protein [Azospirillum oleiclasticum]NYZ16575.1 tetratricopeptide repeat protein [Azospirillum oleiclasticum]NYZ23955.1 tetratricopeptide repeat protein [Azospirillum oleiclasticum]